jgi:hypothetical protein
MLSKNKLIPAFWDFAMKTDGLFELKSIRKLGRLKRERIGGNASAYDLRYHSSMPSQS